MNFFFDANMSPRYARMIHELCEDSHQIVHITEHEDFLHNNVLSANGRAAGNRTKDVEWLAKLGESEEGWKVISGDSRIITVAHERAALRQAKLTFFAMDHNWMNLRFHEQAWKLVKIWEDVVRCSYVPEPTLYEVRMGKKLSINKI